MGVPAGIATACPCAWAPFRCRASRVHRRCHRGDRLRIRARHRSHVSTHLGRPGMQNRARPPSTDCQPDPFLGLLYGKNGALAHVDLGAESWGVAGGSGYLGSSWLVAGCGEHGGLHLLEAFVPADVVGLVVGAFPGGSIAVPDGAAGERAPGPGRARVVRNSSDSAPVLRQSLRPGGDGQLAVCPVDEVPAGVGDRDAKEVGHVDGGPVVAAGRGARGGGWPSARAGQSSLYEVGEGQDWRPLPGGEAVGAVGRGRSRSRDRNSGLESDVRRRRGRRGAGRRGRVLRVCQRRVLWPTAMTHLAGNDRVDAPGGGARAT